MADESTPVVVIPKRTSERVETLADGVLELLLERIRNKTATASEIKEAREYIKECGIRLIVSGGTKAGELAKSLPTFDDEEDSKLLELPRGVTLRRA